jgi:hypothetical protein
MRIVKDKPTSREASFKEDKNEDFETDEIEAKFVRRLKKGSGKYQGKLPFKCVNCRKLPFKWPKRIMIIKSWEVMLMMKKSVVELEGELISTLEEITRLRSKKKKQKQLLIQFEKDNKEPDEDFSLLKVELEEAKKIEDILKQQLSKKKARCEALEEEVVKTRKEMEKFKTLYLQNLPSIKATAELNDILRK